ASAIMPLRDQEYWSSGSCVASGAIVDHRWTECEESLGMDEHVLQEQLRYYRERAAEYDATVLSDGDAVVDPQAQELRAWPPSIMARLAPCEQAVELACGTGIWTSPLLSVAQRILAVDASPEMLALNRAKVADARVRYQLADLFAWEAEAPVDLA